MSDDMRAPDIKIQRLDHLVLTVADVERSCTFYSQVLQFEAIKKGGRTALHFGQQKINLHEFGKEREPKAARPTPGSADLCFVAAASLDEVARRLAEAGVPIEEGPVERHGALGTISSLYFRDPDGNLIEVSNYYP